MYAVSGAAAPSSLKRSGLLCYTNNVKGPRFTSGPGKIARQGADSSFYGHISGWLVIAANGEDVSGFRFSSPRISLVICALCLAADVSAANDKMPWHLPEWEFRQVVKLLTPDPTGKMNTGLVELESVPPQVAEDGKDIRVLDAQGRNVEFEVLSAKDKGAPILPAGLGPSGLRLYFHVTNPGIRYYYVYFGNPKAASAATTWEKHIGGLILETRVNALRRTAANFRQMQRLIATSKWRYGQGPRRQINDPENPFGPNENYLSIYKGVLYCPVDGTYGFATDCDDSSFLLIDGEVVVQRPGGNNPSGQFKKHCADKDLTTGMHKIEYYHVQTGGGSLAKAGWRLPGTDTFVTIPESAFVTALRTETVAMEKRDAPFCAFFKCELTDSMQFGNSGPVFATVRFYDRSRSAAGTPATRVAGKATAWRWEFGDGTGAQGPSPVHTFPGPASYKVTLHCKDDRGDKSSWTKTIRIGPKGRRRIDVTLEVTPVAVLLLPDEAVRVRVKCRRSGSRELPLNLLAEVRSKEGAVLDQEREPLSLPPDDWHVKEIEPARIARKEIGEGQVKCGLEYRGRMVAAQTISVRRASDPNPSLAVRNDRLTDGEGRLVVLRLSAASYKRRGAALLQKLRKGSAVSLLFVDDSLAGVGEGGYIGIVKAHIEKQFPTASVSLTRVGLHRDKGGWPHGSYAGLMGVIEAVREKQPDAVVVAGSLRDVIRFTPIARYERRIHALVDLLEGAGGTQLLLITPPPTIANPGLAKGYAIAIKRVGLRRRVPVADVYSAFMIAGEERAGSRAGQRPNGWEAFYRDPESAAPIYHLSPAAPGQEIIAYVVGRLLLSEPD